MKKLAAKGGLVAMLGLLLVAAGPAPVEGQADPASLAALSDRMSLAADAFLESLRGNQRRLAQLEFTDSARMEWEFIPTYREGLPMADMSAEQRILVHELLRVALSGSGYLKVNTVMHLDEILRQFDTSGFARSGEGYMLAIFGNPVGDAHWGWRFEGHHVSINFTSERPDAISATPFFLGANPAEVRGGIWTGLRTLAEEEDLGWLLLETMSADQRSRAIVSGEAPTDILTRNDPVARQLPLEGLPASEMTTEQRSLLLALIGTYAGNVADAVAEPRLSAIRDAGFDNLHFVWMGGTDRGSPYYYRIQGPTTLIELDNVQGGGNHVHSVWRDLNNDFGGDPLRSHYRASH